MDQLADLAAAQSRRLDCDTVLREVERNHPGQLGQDATDSQYLSRSRFQLDLSILECHGTVSVLLTSCLHCMHFICDVVHGIQEDLLKVHLHCIMGHAVDGMYYAAS